MSDDTSRCKVPTIRSQIENSQPLCTTDCDNRGGSKPMIRNSNDGKEYSMNEDADTKMFSDTEICYINRLPQEIIEIIFSNLIKKNGEYNEKLRLVCRSWYDLCSSKKFLRFSEESGTLGTSTFLENCGYKKLHLEFEFTKIDAIRDLSVNVWEKFGPKVESLILSYCPFVDVDRIMEYVILYCENLKHLCLHIIKEDATLFYSSQIFEALNVVRPKLESLEIRSAPYGVGTQKGVIIFTNLIRIFPNIIHFKFGHGRSYDMNHFHFKLSRQLKDIHKSSISSCLAHLMTDEWKKVLNEMDKLRLTAVSLGVRRYDLIENGNAFLNFFNNQKTLESVKIYLTDDDSRAREDMLISIFLAIIQNSSHLRQLEIISIFAYTNWLNNLLSSANLSRLNNFRIGPVKVNSRSLSLIYSLSNSHVSRNAIDWFPKFSHIRHLTLPIHFADEFLQGICLHMTLLKSLRLHLDECNSSYALTGRRDQTQPSSSDGYSINRLRNLEKLEILWIVKKRIEKYYIHVDNTEELRKFDMLFYEFDFPKLRYLRCFTPKEFSTCTNITQKMPLLTELQFDYSSNVPLNALVELAKQTKYLHTLRLPAEHFNELEAAEIFGICPSLHFLYTKHHVYYHEPWTKELRKVLQKS